MSSAFRREGIVAVAPSLAKLAVAVLDAEFGLLIAGYATTVADGIALRIEGSGEAFIAFPTDPPTVAVPDDVLVFASHSMIPLCCKIDCQLQECNLRHHIARVTANCKGEKMEPHFANEDFYAALDAQRQGRRLTWKKVADEAGVSASTLTRLAQGRRPDVDTLAVLCRWSGLKADDYLGPKENISGRAEPLAVALGHLRADPNLTKEGAQAIETLLKTAYEQFRKR
jgi:transcriptional regulator with XRE-family HTH domain